MSDFRDKVLDVVRSIPEGKTMTYAEVAAAADLECFMTTLMF